MAAMPALRTTDELYPPKASDEVKALLQSIVAFRPDERGKPSELGRALSVAERSMLNSRKAVLDHWLQPGSPNRMNLAINEMFTGFGGPELSPEAQDHRNANYAFACRDRPLFAIERACIRFRRGDVRPDEVGEEKLSLTWRPSSAHLNVLAGRIEDDLQKERAAVDEVLRATVFLEKPKVDPAEVEKVIDAAAEHLRKRAAEKHLETVKRQLDAEAESGELRRRSIADADETYRRAGLKPPNLLPGQTPVTLQMRLSFGWTIEEVDGERVLVSPRKQEAEA
jgi:hypothetical protein